MLDALIERDSAGIAVPAAKTHGRANRAEHDLDGNAARHPPAGAVGGVVREDNVPRGSFDSPPSFTASAQCDSGTAN